jgi:hypothetical protein
METDSLVWTKEKPVKAGWYFARKDGTVSVHRVVFDNKRAGIAPLQLYVQDEGNWVPMSKMPERMFAWAGPIPEPEEPSPYTVDDKGYVYRDGKPVMGAEADYLLRVCCSMPLPDPQEAP